MRFLERALLACSMLLERCAKDRARGRKRGRLGERKTDKEEEPVIIFLNTSCRLFFPKCVKMSNFLLSRETQKSRRHLVHAKPLRSQGCKPPGTVKCGGRRCQVCVHLKLVLKNGSQYPFYIVFGLLVLAFALSFCLVEAK